MNYVSPPGITAFDHALELAAAIAKNGSFPVSWALFLNLQFCCQLLWRFVLLNKQYRGQKILPWKQVSFVLGSWLYDWFDGFLGLDFERATYESLLTTRDRIEALEAFREKRRPIFTGE